MWERFCILGIIRLGGVYLSTMILSASRRTDIPAFFHEWFFNRVKEGFVLVRNPMNAGQVSRVTLTPDIVDCIVFWTKNPEAMIPWLDRLEKYHYYFQFTLTPYGKETEAHLPGKAKIIDTFRRLSDRLGAYKVVWRYDPIFVNTKYTVSYHVEHFGIIANALRGYTEKATISFIDMYSKTERNMSGQKPEAISQETKREIARQLADTARENSLAIETCAQDIELCQYGITRAKCIDDNLVSRIIGCLIDIRKDKSQRRECGCVASVDIGAYNTCLHGCLYCYANHSHSAVLENTQAHDKLSPLLIGKCSGLDGYTEREAKSSRRVQGELWG